MATTTSSSFSSSEQDVITRSINIKASSKQKSESELWTYYELDKCVEFIKSYSHVALQFPDHLLPDAPNVTLILNQMTGKESFILGDTSYGSCCVDEVGAEHLSADGIIHFGASCLTETRRLPVLYIFGKEEIDVEDCRDKFVQCFSDQSSRILILYDVVYSHVIDSLSDQLSPLYSNLIISQLIIPPPPPLVQSSVGVVSKGGVSSTCGCGANSECDSVRSDPLIPPSDYKPSVFTFNRFGRGANITGPLEDYSIFYIGEEGPTLTNFMLTYRDNQFYSYNPVQKFYRQETTNVNSMLRRRYYLIQKAKEANTVGILVGTLGAVNYLPMIERLKSILKNAGKKSYTVAVGKLNPAKLANFMEIELYVLVACPHCSLLDSQEYYRPIVTPFEMEVACLSSRSWTGDVIMSYQELLPGGAHFVGTETDFRSEEPEFSFLTGKLLSGSANMEVGVANSKGVVPRDSTDLCLPYSGASHLQTRSWKGLERRLGEKWEEEGEGLVEGRSGLPVGYTHEREHLVILANLMKNTKF